MTEDILSRLQNAQSSEEKEWLVLELNLKNLHDSVQAMVWAAAIPHWFDRPFLAAILKKPENELGDWERLIALSYIEPFPERGFSVHERTRHLLLNRLWQDSLDRFSGLSRLAADYCTTQNLDDPAWRIEWIYHLLVAEPDEGASQLQNNGWTWQNSPNFAFDLVEAMAAAAREQANGSRLNKRGQGWTLFWEAHLDKIYSRNLSAKKRLFAIQITADEDQYLSADSFQALGDVHVRLSEYEAAREQYKAALHIYEAIGDQRGQANCIKTLGDVHVQFSEYEAARERYEEALPIYEAIGARLGQANCIKALGDVHVRLSEYEAARERYEEALPIYEVIGDRLGQANTITAFGELEYLQENYLNAKTRFEHVLPMYRSIGERTWQTYVAYFLGLTLKSLKQSEYALQVLAEGVALSRQIDGNPNLSLLKNLITEIDTESQHESNE